MSHTEGKLVADALDITLNGAQSNYYCIGKTGTRDVVAIVGKVGDGRDELSIADASRLVACWNACDGLLKDTLDGGWTASGINQYARGLEIERDELVKALDILERLSGLAMMEDDPVRVAARTILARYAEGKS